MNRPRQEKMAWTDEQVSAALHRAKLKLETLHNQLCEPLAVIGMGCRFPQASGPDRFWDLLMQGRSAVTETPAERWDGSLTASVVKEPGKVTANRGAFLDSVDQFDASFFGMTRREAETVDPQQRLLLEVAWETLEHAALDAGELRGSRTGVFVGMCSSDYLHKLAKRDVNAIDAYLGTGNAHGAAAGRLSYFMDWQGPSIAVDTACSSSLTALHLAVRSLRYGDCDMALVAGVNLILTPELSINFSQAGMLSPTGLCHTFSAAADGFVRGEGCGAVLLKSLSRALADGDRIFCVVRGSASNQDGHSNGLTAPNGVSQQAVIRAALADARVSPEQIDYIEAHGTGTELGDPVEMGALGSVFGPGRDVRSPLRVGAVKTNIGHLEAAAGIAGIIKLALALHHQELPAHLNFETPSPHIDWDLPLEVPTQPTAWRHGDRVRIGGVSSFGFGGTNVHVVLEEAPQAESARADVSKPHAGKSVLTVSSKTPTALTRQASRYARRVCGAGALSDICYTANTGRADFDCRLAVPATTVDELAGKLAEFSASGQAVGAFAGSASQEFAVHWLFGDEATYQFGAGGRILYERHPVFREVIDRCETAFRDLWPRSLKAILWQDQQLCRAPDALPALFCLQCATARLWQSWGIAPDVVMGHRFGEYAAAASAGLFSFEDGLMLVTRRAELMARSADAQGMLRDLTTSAERVCYAVPRHAYVSTAEVAGSRGDITSPSYWARLMEEPSDLAAAVRRVAKSSGALYLEMGAGSSLGGSIGAELNVLPGLTAGENEWDIVVENLSRLYVAGATINWQMFERAGGRRISLPTCPFERQRYWYDKTSATHNSAHQTSIPATGEPVHPLLGVRLDLGGREIVFETDLSRSDYLSDHRIGSSIVFPAAGFLELAMAAERHAGQGRLELTDLDIMRPVFWDEGESCRVQVILAPREEGFDCQIVRFDSGDWRVCARCELVPVEGTCENGESIPCAGGSVPCAHGEGVAFRVEEHYSRCREAGFDYGPAFQGLESLVIGQHHASGDVSLPGHVESTGYLLHPAQLDSCFQVAAGALGERRQTAWLPVRVGRYRIFATSTVGANLHVHASLRPAEGDLIHVDFRIADQDGRLIAEVESLSFKPIRKMDSSRSAPQSDRAVARKILLTPHGQREAALLTYLHGQLAEIMDMNIEEIPSDKPLNSLGLDSLMALELHDQLERDFNVNMPMELFLQDLSLIDFAAALLRKLDDAKVAAEGQVLASDVSPSAAGSDRWMEGAL